MALENNTNDIVEVYNYLNNTQYNKNNLLLYHQNIVLSYFKKFSKRGLLVFHGTGSGKTLLSLALAKEFNKEYKIVVISPKSTQDNFKKDLLKLDSDIHLNFVSLNAGNMITQLSNIGKTKRVIKLEKGIESHVSLNNMFIIVDEAQNLFNGIVNGSQNATEFYRLCIKAKNVKLVFLSATPITNNPFEIVPIFNMLAGYSLLPEDYSDFNELFGESENGLIKNIDILKNRIFGLTTYVGDLHKPISVNKIIKRDNFPNQLRTIIEKVPMSSEQFNSYSHARDKERPTKNDSMYKKKVKHMQIPKSGSGSVYRVYTRQLSNFLYDTPGSVQLKTQDLKTNSPKIKRLLVNLANHKNNISLVYSNFIKNGLEIIKSVLLSKGYNEYDHYNIRYNNSFVMITGNVNENERVKLINVFNSKQNKNGKYIKIMLLSPTGAEGLDLKNVCSVHILDPYWNYGRIEQIIARAIRYNSHLDLELTDRVVQPYLYLADYPVNYKGNQKELTTDIQLYSNSLKKKENILNYYYMIIESSLDCKINFKGNEKINCLDCNPTNNVLFLKNIKKDILKGNNCLKRESKELTVKVIVYKGKEYYYTVTGKYDYITIYSFNKQLDSYLQLESDNEVYNDVLESVASILEI